MLYDGDRVCCHLSGRWLELVGDHHAIAAYGITVEQYREMFCLFGNVTAAAPATPELRRRSMLEQIAGGQRDQSVLLAPSLPTVWRWRSLRVVRPDVARGWYLTRSGELDPFEPGQRSHRKVLGRCSDCGHESRTSPDERTSGGKGCPACGRRRSIAASIDRGHRFLRTGRSRLSVQTCSPNGIQC
jgi:hypothetical protein